jgi:hypothetical protein
MSRDAGFANADLDTGIARDPKFRRLARLHPDLIAVAFAGYIGLLAESWGSGERRVATDGWPEIISYNDEAVAALIEVGLLDRASRLPAKAWKSWYGVACSRRELRRSAGSLGGQRRSSNARAKLEQSPSDALPVPSVPSVPSVPAPRASFDGPGDDLQSLLASWGVIGLPLGPKLTVRLDGLVEDHGGAAVRAQFDRLHTGGSKEAGQYILGASNSLRPIPPPDKGDNSAAIAATARDYPPSEVWYPPNPRQPNPMQRREP